MRCKLKSINTEYFLSQQIWIRTESLYHKQNQTSNANTNQTTEKNAKKPFNLIGWNYKFDFKRFGKWSRELETRSLTYRTGKYNRKMRWLDFQPQLVTLGINNYDQILDIKKRASIFNEEKSGNWPPVWEEGFAV
jgi:hypothetical protein